MQEERSYEDALQGIDGYEYMVNISAQNAKAYWKQWGPIGEPMIRSIEVCGDAGCLPPVAA